MTRGIILAAGTGSRLKPITDSKPKGLVTIANLPLVDRIIKLMKICGISDIVIVTGYMNECYEVFGENLVNNDNFSETNMVHSLFCASPIMNGEQDIIVSYADINYEIDVLKQLIEDSSEIAITADREWEKLWSARMEDYITDIETFSVSKDGLVTDIGMKPTNEDIIDGQYIGLIKFGKTAQKKILGFYAELKSSESIFEGETIEKMYMTTFLRYLIKKGLKIKANFISGGWIEVDTMQDYNIYKNLEMQGKLNSLCKLLRPESPKSILEKFIGNKMIETECKEYYALYIFIGRVYNGKIDCEKTKRLANLFSRKVEIAKKIYNKYDLNGKRLIDSSILNKEEMGALVSAFLMLYKHSNKIRHLNTAIKALDRNLIDDSIEFYYDLNHCCEKELCNV